MVLCLCVRFFVCVCAFVIKNEKKKKKFFYFSTLKFITGRRVMCADVQQSDLSAACQASSTGETFQHFCTCSLTRPPCCCQVLFTADDRALRAQHHYPHHTHWHSEEPRGGKGYSQQQRPPRHLLSRRCLYCVPEQETLHECEQLEKKERNRSLRAERQQLQAALQDVWRQRGESSQERPLEKSYRTNTTHLLRCTQRPFYRRVVEKEQERRRLELQKEIAERKREMGTRGLFHQPVVANTSSPRIFRSKIPGGRLRREGHARQYLAVCPTSGLSQHGRQDRTTQRPQVSTAAAAAEAPPCDDGNSGPAAAERREEEKSGKVPKTAVGRGFSHLGGGAKKPLYPHASPLRVEHRVCCCRCCCCCKCCCRIYSGDVIATRKHKGDAMQSDAPKEVAKSPVPLLQAATQTTKHVVASPRVRQDPADYGRKVYITDDAYLSWRTKVIEGLERHGFVRLIPPTTRSPSAPLPVKRKKWATTRSTSAHRV